MILLRILAVLGLALLFAGVMRSYIVDAFGVAILMFGFSHSMDRPPPVPSDVKRRHFLVTLLIIILTVRAIGVVGYFVAHPELAYARFYVGKGPIPAWLAFSLQVADAILGSAVCLLASMLCRRAAKARRIFLPLWSLLVLLWLVESITGALTIGNKNLGLAALVGLCFASCYAGIGILVSWHLRSPSAHVLFAQPNTSLEPTATALADSRIR